MIEASTESSTGTNSKVNAKLNSELEAAQAQSIAEAIEQMKAATNAIYQAIGSMGHASSDMAKIKVKEGKAKVSDFGHKAETAISEKPLMYVGIAFAAGWLFSRLTK